MSRSDALSLATLLHEVGFNLLVYDSALRRLAAGSEYPGCGTGRYVAGGVSCRSA